MNDDLLWTPTHEHTSVGRPAKPFIQQLVSSLDWFDRIKGWREKERERERERKRKRKRKRDGERKSRISVQPERIDDDNDDDDYTAKRNLSEHFYFDFL